MSPPEPNPVPNPVALPRSATSFRVVIPARYGASRLPGKPLLDLGGHPLLLRVWERAMASGAADVVIATDDERIAGVASAAGADVAMTGRHHRSGSERIAEVVAARGWPADAIVVNVQGDEPGLPPALIEQVAATLAAHTGIGMATLATPLLTRAELFDPDLVKVVTDATGRALYFSRAPIPWHRETFRDANDADILPEHCGWLRHIGLYAYRVAFLARYVAWPPAALEQIEALEQLRVLWHGERIQVALAATAPGPGIDTPADLERARAWWQATAGSASNA
ncbi:MAG: 3-deoxy-manno-octulosonate cytidylyltransferase [Chromatiaceae bacterium]|nr:MAG: 3-deoxy-manno-octulosonate cytidylyltransferase [Chromatiaceae bacterium]